MAKLKQKKYRLKERQFLVEGRHLIEEAYLAGYLVMVLYIDDNPIQQIDSYRVTEEIILKLSDVESNQGLIGVCRLPEKSLLTRRLLMLDGIQDPGNMGTLLRTSVAFGFGTIIMDQCVDIFNPKVIRSTQGAIFKLNFIYDDLTDFINNHSDYQYIATDLKADQYLEDVVLENSNIGLILGNEGQGIRRVVSERADLKVKIKMHDTESLNVAIAGSICMYQFKGE